MNGRTGIGATALALSFALAVAGQVNAQCTLAWDPQFGPPGASHITHCAAVFDDALYVGGEFTSISGLDTTSIARFDGEQWSKVGGTFVGNVFAMAVFDDGNGPALYAAGNFISIGGNPIQNIAKWNGTAWSALPGGTINNTVNFLYVSDAPFGSERLYASGFFTSINGNPIQGLAVYDGSTWSSVAGTAFNNGTRVVEFDDPATVPTDVFISKGVEGIFRFDGTSLVNVAPNGVSGGSAFTLEAYDDGNGPCLYAGGDFSSINGVSAHRLAKWNGTTWSEFGGGVTSGVQHHVRHLRVWDDGNGPSLYVSGMFLTAGTTPAQNIARWNGTSWSALAGGVGQALSGFPEARWMTPFDAGEGEGLVVLGGFLNPRQNLAFWNGSAFTGMSANGMGVVTPTSRIFDFVTYEDEDDGPLLVACGNFQNAGPAQANRVAAWDGHSWRALGPGFNQDTRALAVYDDGNGPQLYAGGAFSMLGNSTLNLFGLARWDGSQWHEVLTNTALTVSPIDMVVHDDGNGPKLYVAGNGSAGTGVVARLDGGQLTQIGTALGRDILALGVFDSGSSESLFLGTNSTQSGLAADNSILRWNGSTWVTVAGGVQRNVGQSHVYSFKSFDNNGTPTLAVGGQFNRAGSVISNGLIYWDGTQWAAPPGPQPDSGVVKAIEIHDDGTGPALYAGGIDIASTAAIDNIAKLGASGWEPLAFGVNGEVFAMCSYDPDGGSSLYVGGSLNRYWTSSAQQIGFDDVRAAAITRWHTCLDEPSMISSPGDQTVPSGSTVVFEAEAGGGNLTFRWRLDGVNLNNNAQRTGVDTNHLTLFNVDDGDEGEYDVVVTNAAGTDTSKSATLTVTLPCFADIDNDNQVSINDLLEVINNWGACIGTCPPACAADIDPAPNGDCQVNINDLLLVINSWGGCP